MITTYFILRRQKRSKMPTNGKKLPSIFSFVHAGSLLGCFVSPATVLPVKSPTDKKENGVFVALGSTLRNNLLHGEKTLSCRQIN